MSGESNVTTAPLVYVQVFMSALSVPVSLRAGRQLSADASVDFQQLFPASQAQSRLPGGGPPPSPLLEQAGTPSETAASMMMEGRIQRE